MAFYAPILERGKKKQSTVTVELVRIKRPAPSEWLLNSGFSKSRRCALEYFVIEKKCRFECTSV